MQNRSFPFTPKSSKQLEIGDLVGVPLEGGNWACLQVLELKGSGPGSMKSLVVGTLPWRGADPPTEDGIRNTVITERALTGVELFTEGGLQVVGNAAVAPNDIPHYYRPLQIGDKQNVWGWRAAISHAREAAGFV